MLIFQIMLYDLRSSKPLLIKDHNYGLPIKKVMFHQDLVLSLDEKVLKIWKERNVCHVHVGIQIIYRKK